MQQKTGIYTVIWGILNRKIRRPQTWDGCRVLNCITGDLADFCFCLINIFTSVPCNSDGGKKSTQLRNRN